MLSPSLKGAATGPRGAAVSRGPAAAGEVDDRGGVEAERERLGGAMVSGPAAEWNGVFRCVPAWAEGGQVAAFQPWGTKVSLNSGDTPRWPAISGRLSSGRRTGPEGRPGAS